MKSTFSELRMGVFLGVLCFNGFCAAQEAMTTEIADVETRYFEFPRPDSPRPVMPLFSTPQSIDSLTKPFWEWQHATFDWFGARPWLSDRGVNFEGTITADWSANFKGGFNTEGTDFRHLLNLTFTLDTKRLLDWEGGTFFINFQNHHGEDGSRNTGDLQAYSNIDADGRTQLSQLFYEQRLLKDKLRIKAGKMDANTDFAAVENGAQFINSSFGISPTIFTLPTYPDPSTGIAVFIEPCECLYAGVGLYDGAAQEGFHTGSRGPRTFFGRPSDLFVIGQTGLKWDCNGLEGTIGIGGWHHTGRFDRFDGSSQRGASGVYAVFDQKLWKPATAKDAKPEEKEHDKRGVGIFAELGWTEDDVSQIDFHLAGGVVWVGPFPGRDGDAVGLAATYAHLSDDPNAGFTEGHETAIEGFYKVEITPFASLKPDLQYIIHPGGNGLPDALVGTLRLEIAF